MVDRTLSGGERVTQFELLTAAAFAELARHEVEVAVVEAGLGGRWDATNVLDAPVVVLTNVGPRAHALARARRSPTSRGRSSPSCGLGATLVLGDESPEVEALAAESGREDRPPGAGRRRSAGFAGALPGYQRRNFARRRGRRRGAPRPSARRRRASPTSPPRRASPAACRSSPTTR